MGAIGMALRRTGHLLRYGDPRTAMVWFGWAASLFGSFVLADSVLVRFRAQTPLEGTLYNSFGVLPGWLVGGAFVVAAGALVWGVAAENRAVIRRAALALMAAWVYVWLTIPVLGVVAGQVYPTAFARYSSPLPVAWWIYARAAYAGGFLGPGVVARDRSGLGAASAVVVVPAAVVALAEAVMLQVEPTAGVPAAAWGVIGAAITALLAYLGQRYAKKTDMNTQLGSDAAEHNRFLLGFYNEQIVTTAKELEHVRGQLSEILRRQETQDHWCRNNCPTYRDRPT